MSYRLVNNKIHTPTACELNVVHHCNLSCRSCSHLAPTFTKHFVEPNQVFNDFSILAKYYRPRAVKLLGGEPLLHPDLLQVISAVRRSGISDCIQVATNGQLLINMSNSFWQQIDELHISIYPGKELSSDLKTFQHKARLYNVKIQQFYFDKFRESYSELGTSDAALVQRIYGNCKIAHIWRNHTISDGYFYKCPQSVFLPKVINNDRLLPKKDGIKITDLPEFANDLLAYLESTEPLLSCYNCLGSVGKLFAHEQIKHKTWRLQQQYSTEELIDMEYLAQSEQNPHLDNLCVSYRSPMEKLIAITKPVRRTLAKHLTWYKNSPSATKGIK